LSYTVTPEFSYSFKDGNEVLSGGNVVSGAKISEFIPEGNKEGFTYS